jgi:hypothetical protein
VSRRHLREAPTARRSTDGRPLSGSRRIGLVLPVFLALIDALATLSVVAEGRRCGPDCTGTLLVLPFTPTLGPLALSGLGEDGSPGLGAVALAYLVTVVLVFAWWRWLTERLGELARGSIVRFFTGWILAVLVTFLLNAAFMAMEDGPGLGAAFTLETALAAVVVWWVSIRSRRARIGLHSGSA